MPFTLSTSQTPTLLYENGSPLDLRTATGSFGPSCRGGYGVSYIIMGDEISMSYKTKLLEY